MITCRLFGRYGNQLYQISACIAHAKRIGVDYVIPTKSISEKLNPSHRYKNVKYGDVALPHYREDETRFNQLPMTDNICLNGYFQDYNYFMDYWNDIKEALSLEWKMMEGIVSIHLRRTDYLQYPDIFTVVSLAYVENSINHFKELGYNDFKIFSDDIEYCKQNITKEKFGVNITHEERKSGIENLVLMSQCEHNVVANSTFSVWAAYLNQNPNKIVIRPPFFLGEKSKHLHKNIYLPEWIVKEN